MLTFATLQVPKQTTTVTKAITSTLSRSEPVRYQASRKDWSTTKLDVVQIASQQQGNHACALRDLAWQAQSGFVLHSATLSLVSQPAWLLYQAITANVLHTTDAVAARQAALDHHSPVADHGL